MNHGVLSGGIIRTAPFSLGRTSSNPKYIFAIYEIDMPIPKRNDELVRDYLEAFMEFHGLFTGVHDPLFTSRYKNEPNFFSDERASYVKSSRGNRFAPMVGKLKEFASERGLEFVEGERAREKLMDVLVHILALRMPRAYNTTLSQERRAKVLAQS